jgi:uncharacterized membrane protein YfcA
MGRRQILAMFAMGLILCIISLAFGGEAQIPTNSSLPWWAWPLILFVFTFVLGIVAVLGGVGGGVLYVPIVGGFFPFNLDFVRGAGLFTALTGALSAGPGLLRRGLADLRLAIPLSVVTSVGAIVGAMIGLALPKNLVNTLLGVTILGIMIIMLRAKKSEFPEVKEPDPIAKALGIGGIYVEPSLGKEIHWTVHRTPIAIVLFAIIGIMAGMFGLGAGWANVPVLNLLMGVPLKVAVSTSVFLLSITDTSAAFIYLNSGAISPMIVIPSIIGIMLGAVVGVKILEVAKPKVIRIMVLGLLFLSGLRALLKGLGIWN